MRTMCYTAQMDLCQRARCISSRSALNFPRHVGADKSIGELSSSAMAVKRPSVMSVLSNPTSNLLWWHALGRQSIPSASAMPPALADSFAGLDNSISLKNVPGMPCKLLAVQAISALSYAPSW